jgi:pimeloyl-ACP methyl ester carboxylesterase
MGDDATSGAVDDVGQVFTGDLAQPRDVYPGLVVLDGSIVPTSLGINPALTIAAVALRAIETLMRRWGLCPDPGLAERARTANISEGRVRPMFRKLRSEAADKAPLPPPPWIVAPVQTEVQLIERLRGSAKLADGKKHHLEFTLHSDPVAVASLMSRTGPRRIQYDPKRSVLRVFDEQPSPLDDDPRELVERRPGTPGERKRAHLEARAKVAGSLDVLRLIPTRYPARTLRALVAWFQHRGLRDWVQWLAEKAAGLEPPADPMTPAAPGWGERLRGIHDIATRAGAARSLDYRLRLHELKTAPGVVPETLFGSRALREGELKVDGQKRLTYDGRSTPWQQLMELTLDRFPGMPPRESARLILDLPYLGRQGVPLLRVVRQHDHVHALVDFAAFHLYVLRTVLDGHMWSFRRPDRVPHREVNLLPGPTPDLQAPQITRIFVDEVKGKPVPIRLTRYRPTQSRHRLPPVLLIHGYSASGTTFVHPTLPGGGLVGRLVREGREAWVLDLRSSAGMPWATHEWSFEHIGREDIPMAVAHIVATCGEKVDVVAHCMGAAMLCMALLGDIPKHAVRGDQYPELREAMRHRIRRIVLSQVGPVVMMSPSNQARAFLMRYVRQLIPMGDYRFRPEGKDSLADNLLDRLVATLPYPADEFRRENPVWPPWASRPWVQTRRRMDALYGQTFKLTNLSDRTLEHLDDFFGPMSVATVSQVIHFTRSRAITDERGRHVFATADRLRTRLDYPILSIHGSENGLVDVSTADLLKEALDSPKHKVERIENFGHQDCLIGENPGQAFDAIVGFLGSDL